MLASHASRSGPKVEALNRHEDEESRHSVCGLKEQRSQMRAMIELQLRHPTLSKMLGVEPPRGVLLYGPAGSGKSLIARAVIKEIDAFSLIINGPEVVSKMDNEAETFLRHTFEEAAKNAPAIIFIEEIDRISSTRFKTNVERHYASLLSLVDGLKGCRQIAVIASINCTSNCLSIIDPDLRRLGRFEKAIHIGVPDDGGRLEILRMLTRNMKLAADVRLEVLSANTTGFGRARLAQLCKESAWQCIHEKMDLIDCEKETICADVFDSMAVTHEHFNTVIG